MNDRDTEIYNNALNRLGFSAPLRFKDYCRVLSAVSKRDFERLLRRSMKLRLEIIQKVLSQGKQLPSGK